MTTTPKTKTTDPEVARWAAEVAAIEKRIAIWTAEKYPLLWTAERDLVFAKRNLADAKRAARTAKPAYLVVTVRLA